MEITIKKACAEDYPLLTKLWEDAHLPYKYKGRDSREHIEKEMNNPNEIFLLGFMQDEPVATVLVTHDGRKGWINRMAVIPSFQKKGIARQMVKAGEDWLIKQGIGIFACMIESYNDGSFQAFQKMGYAPFEGIHYLTKRLDPEI
jgi:GNAT superfamily N-acetyltransferase